MAFREPYGIRWLQATLVALLTTLGAGCNCNAEYSFPPVEEPAPIDPPARLGSWLSFDSSPDGQQLTMSYYDQDAKGVGYAVGTPAPDGTVAWNHEQVDGYPVGGLDAGTLGTYTSQKTAPDGTVWVAYHDFGKGALKAAHRLSGGVWDVPVVVDGGTSLPGVGLWASLAIGADGQPVIAHCEKASGAVRVSRYDGSAWSTTQVFASRPVDETDADGVVTVRPAGVGYADLLVNGDTEILAFYDSAAGALHVMQGKGGVFTDEIVDDEGDTGAWPSLAVSSSGAITVAYQDVGNEDLKYAEASPAGWTRETVDAGELRGADTALFVRPGGPAILYFDGMNNDAWLAVREDGEWTREIVAEEGALGFHNEVVFAAGLWWAGSFDYTANQLFVKAL